MVSGWVSGRELFKRRRCARRFRSPLRSGLSSPALRLKDSDYEASLAEYAEAVRKRAAGLASWG